MNLFSELKRRKVYQVAAIYTAAAWGLLQVADVMFPRLGLPDWTVTFLFALELIGFPLALILSWIFDFKTGGIVRTGTDDTAAVPNRESLAVLPFNNMSDDPSLDHLADGLVEDLITRLQGNIGIPVNSRNSCFVYKGEAVDIVKAAEELGAAFIVEGSVRVQGDIARVTAQLINAENDHHLWAEKYDRPIGDIFALQDELVESMAQAITRHISAEEIAQGAPEESTDQPAGLRKSWVALTAVVVLSLAGVLTWSLEQRGDERWAREVALPEIEQLIAADDMIGAFSRINEVMETLPTDPLVLKYRDAISNMATIISQPAGAQVFYKVYDAPGNEWQHLGVSPLHDVRLPKGYLQLKFEGEGLVSTTRAVRNPAALLNNFAPSAAIRFTESKSVIHLVSTAESREGMVYIEPWEGQIGLPDDAPEGAKPVPAYFIDSFEVSNSGFQDFVDAGGYSNGQYWQGLDFGDTDWSEAVQAFTDQTGQSGPAGWEMGQFRSGTGDHPVTGVNWFEAMAYARFRGKELPTIYHWYRAALDSLEVISPLAPAVIPQSNFAGKGLAAVGQYQGLGYFGAYDMGGNAREWLANAAGAAGDLRWIVGGSWNQVPYMFFQSDYASPWDRGPGNGFRCIASADGNPVPALLGKATEIQTGADPLLEPPVDDQTYAILRDQFGYFRQDLQPQLISNEQKDYWREEKIHISSPYTEDGMILLLMIPNQGEPPLQAMVMMPGSDAFSEGARLDGYDWNGYEPSIPAVLRSGRAVVLPVWDGVYGRGRQWADIDDEAWPEYMRIQVLRWRQDLGTALDYLQTRDDFDSDRIGFLGVSWGASAPISAIANEPRLKTAIMVAGGLVMSSHPAMVQPKNHAPRVTIPVLMINGRYDQTFPLESHQKPLFELFGSAPEEKKHVIYEAGHVGFPVSQQRREIFAWLDTYLGPVP